MKSIPTQLLLPEIKERICQRDKHFLLKEKKLGQFITPYEIAKFIVDFCLLLTDKREIAIDPACGNGIFLKALIQAGFKKVIGIDIDKGIIKKIPMIVKENAKIVIGDGLLYTSDIVGRADVVVGNPPFSAKYGRVSGSLLSLYELGKNKKTQAIEILFLEKFIRLVSSGGIIGIILPCGIFTNLSLRYVREFILNNLRIYAIISLPRGIFSSGCGTSSKTYVLIAEKGGRTQKIFMGVVNTFNDLSKILLAFKNKLVLQDVQTFWVEPSIDTFYPEYFIFNRSYLEGHKIAKKLKDVISELHCGRTEYGKERIFSEFGIPYISAKTITKNGLDLNKDKKYVDPKSKMYKIRAQTKVGDLLFVRVGLGCIGRAAVVTKPSECGVADDYIYIIRTKNRDMAYYLAFYFQTKYGISQINAMRRGVGTVTIPQSLLKEMVIIVPPVYLIRKMKNSYLKMVNNKKNVVEAERIRQNAIRDIERWIEQH